MSLFSTWFWKTYRFGEGWFKNDVSVELPRWKFFLFGLILFGAGFAVGAVVL